MKTFTLKKLVALCTVSLFLTACGGGGGGDSSTGSTTPPAQNTDLFTAKAKKWTIVPAANQSYCYDIDTQKEIDCTVADWDLKFAMGTRTPSLFTNSGVSGSGSGGALYSPFNATWTDLLKEKDATQGGAIPDAAWIKDAYSNAFMDTTSGKMSSFFEYDLFGDHRMSPNFKVFLLTTDKTSTSVTGTAEKPVFALQIVNYYQGTASGYMTLRYMDTRTQEVKNLTVNATSAWQYIDLSTGTYSDKANGNWQIAFNRYNVQLNTTAGSQVFAQPAGFYDENNAVVLTKFKDSNAFSDTLTDLKNAVNATGIKWTSNSITSLLNPTFQGTYPAKLSYGWYNYYPTLQAAQADGLQAAHMLKANPDQATIIKGNTGKSYARMHLADLSYADPSSNASQTTWTFEFDIQPAK
ncbi:hypothetical protein CDG60_09025 [Acinetobacter chinensis]|uniref:Heme-binding HmuY-like protein n=1 Tax=Acinetobacter chinensis TaxID=2004650 RepID=A0A3B7LYL2_9GAMM|nr:HmuY family protein [Acinetobacter chinensis]AXY56697.1 hypothetical protein CDG60_09025 [Acinetobacter chinensis]